VRVEVHSQWNSCCVFILASMNVSVAYTLSETKEAVGDILIQVQLTAWL